MIQSIEGSTCDLHIVAAWMHGHHLCSEIPGRVSPRLLRGILGDLRYMELWGPGIGQLGTWGLLRGEGAMTFTSWAFVCWFKPTCVVCKAAQEKLGG